MDKTGRQRAIELRLKKELSYSEITKRLKVPKSTLSYWLRDFPLSDQRILELRRKGWKNGEASREKFRNTMRRKKEAASRKIYEEYQKKFDDLSAGTFFIAGLMLYLGEGDKKNPSRIGLVNTDPLIIKFFVKWMIDFLDISRLKIRAQLTLYDNMPIENEKKFWKNELGLTLSQFYRPTIKLLQNSNSLYREPYRHGTCGIYFNSVEMKTKIMMAIKALLENYIKK